MSPSYMNYTDPMKEELDRKMGELCKWATLEERLAVRRVLIRDQVRHLERLVRELEADLEETRSRRDEWQLRLEGKDPESQMVVNAL